MAFYFVSDLHFQHLKVALSRGFTSPEEHDQTIISNINKIVNSTDDLFVLGDIAMNANNLGWRHNLNLIDQLHGTKHLIAGNHDRCAVNNTQGFNYQLEFLKHFKSINDFARLSADGYRIMLSHYPYYDSDSELYHEGAANQNKYQQYRLPDRGSILIHGHTHSKLLVTYSQKGTIQINVNLESTDLKPVSLSQIMNIVTSHNFNVNK